MRAKKLAAIGEPVLAQFLAGPNAALLTLPNGTLFIADGDYELAQVQEVHEVLGTDGGAVALDIVKCTGTQTAAQGTTMLRSTFDLKAAINTVVKKNLSNAGLTLTAANRLIRNGERVALSFSGTMTAVAGLRVQATLIRRSVVNY